MDMALKLVKDAEIEGGLADLLELQK